MTQAESKALPVEPATMLERFLEHESLRGLADRTLAERRIILEGFARHIPKPLLDATRDDIERFLETRKLGPQGRCTYLSHISQFYRWAILEQLAPLDPTARIPRPKIPRRLPRPVPSPMARHALELAPTLDRIWLYLATYQGLRCCEIARMLPCDILDYRDPPMLVVHGKGGKDRMLPLHPEVAALLPRTGPFVFNSPKGGGYQPRTISQRLSRYLNQIDCGLTAHRFRHLFGTMVYAESQDIRVTQELMGHTSPATTALYVAFSASKAAEVVRSLKV